MTISLINHVWRTTASQVSWRFVMNSKLNRSSLYCWWLDMSIVLFICTVFWRRLQNTTSVCRILPPIIGLSLWQHILHSRRLNMDIIHTRPRLPSITKLSSLRFWETRDHTQPGSLFKREDERPQERVWSLGTAYFAGSERTTSGDCPDGEQKGAPRYMGYIWQILVINTGYGFSEADRKPPPNFSENTPSLGWATAAVFMRFTLSRNSVSGSRLC